MSKAPESLKAVKRYLVDKTGHQGSISIRGFVGAKRVWGYHLGRSDIYGPGGMGNDDYSIRRLRDRAGLTEASAALDISRPFPIPELKRIAAYLVNGVRAGMFDLAEVIGPDAAGQPKRWAIDNGWKPKPATKGHKTHVHVGFPRDTEFADRVAIFEGLYGPRSEPADDPDDPPAADPDDPDPMPTPPDCELERDDALDALRQISAIVLDALTDEAP